MILLPTILVIILFLQRVLRNFYEKCKLKYHTISEYYHEDIVTKTLMVATAISGFCNICFYSKCPLALLFGLTGLGIMTNTIHSLSKKIHYFSLFHIIIYTTLLLFLHNKYYISLLLGLLIIVYVFQFNNKNRKTQAFYMESVILASIVFITTTMTIPL